MKKIMTAAACFFLGHYAMAQLNYTLVTSGLNTLSFESGLSEFEVGDIDGDGDLDIVSIGDHGCPQGGESGIMVWKNNGTGTAWSLSYKGNFGYGGVALGDVNNDGKMDIGYGMHHNNSSTDFGDQVLEVALGDGTGANWTPYDDGLASNGQQTGMFGTDFGDINNDGLLDIVSNGFGCCDGIWLYKNDGNGHWTKTDGSLGGNSQMQCKLGDFNNDGNVDMAVANEWGQIWKNDGTGNVSPMQNGIADDFLTEFGIGDVNNDGAKDIAVGRGDSVEVYTFDKTSQTWKSISNGLPGVGYFYPVLDDMDMDGNCDLILCCATGIKIYKGDGAGNWTLNGSISKSIPSAYSVAGLTTGDLDHDGYSDIVVLAHDATNQLEVYLHSATSSHGINILPSDPKGFECFAPGSVHFVKWKSVVPAGPLATVKIEFSSTGSAGPWTTVAASAPNSGLYQWITPSVSSPNCYLKYTITQGSSNQSVVMSNAFGIGSCTTPATGINESGNEVQDLVSFPNPMSISGVVEFRSIVPVFTKIEIYDVVGRKVSNVLNEMLNAGEHKIQFSTADINSGIYFLEVKTEAQVMKNKIVIVH